MVYSTVQYSTVQCSTVQYSTVQYMLDRVLGARLDTGGRHLLEELTAWLRSLR